MIPTPSGSCEQRLLVDHAERGEQPDLVDALLVHHPEARVVVAVLGADRLAVAAGTPCGVRPEALPRKYSDIAPALAIGSNVGLTTAWFTLPPITWYFRPSISAHWTMRRPSSRIEVPGERVDRLVVVVVAVEDETVRGGHVGVRKCAHGRQGSGMVRPFR